MKSLSIIFLMIGIVFIISGYFKSIYKCPPTKIEYRYIPRSFYDEQNAEYSLKEIYKTMFDEGSTWTTYPNNSDDASKPRKDGNKFIDNISY